jgi:ABC-type oligopeptide transport system ATPase subunit
MPINVPELKRLVDKTDEVKYRIKGKNILFMIGTTGSGKSTNILKFLDYNLRVA